MERQVGQVLEGWREGRITRGDRDLSLLVLVEAPEDAGELMSLLPAGIREELKGTVRSILGTGSVQSAERLSPDQVGSLMRRQREEASRLRSKAIPALRKWVEDGMAVPPPPG